MIHIQELVEMLKADPKQVKKWLLEVMKIGGISIFILVVSLLFVSLFL